MSDIIQPNISTTVENVNVFVTGITSSNINVVGDLIPEPNFVTNITQPVNNIDVIVTDITAKEIGVDFFYPQGPAGPAGPKGDPGSSLWGTISGTLSAQTDLWQYLSAGFGLDIFTLNDYLSTNNIVLSSATILDNFITLGSATITKDLSVGGDLFVDGTLYTQNTAIVLATYYTRIGDGVNNTYNILHNLGSQDVHVVVRDVNSNLLAFPAIQPIDDISVNVSFNFIPTLSSYSVSIFAGVPSNRITAYKEELIIPPRPIANTFYVSMSGNDFNSGTEITAPLRTIRKACQLAHNARVESRNNPNIKYTVFVGTGDYYEQNPIYISPNTSIIGDNLRRVNVFPVNKQYDMFWVDNSIYVWGFTFRGHLEPAAVFAFPNYKVPALTAIALNGYSTPYVSPGNFRWRRPYITTSPYIQGSSSIASSLNGIPPGCGMRVDGSLAEGFLRSMVLDSYTQFNEGGNGIEIINNGYAQLVSIFTICCTEGMVCRSGGSCSISNSNCSFGLSGLVATGKSPTPILTGVLVNFLSTPDDPFVTSTLVMSGVNGTDIFPDSDYYPTLLNTPGIGLDTRKIAYAPYDNLVFELGNDPTLYTISGAPLSSGSGAFTVNTIQRINNTSIVTGIPVRFYIRSTIYASAHTFEFVGTGTQLRNAVPALGGVATPETEVAYDNGGAIYYTSTNHTGDFSIGDEFRVVQSTGIVEGDTFRRSILTLVTPLTLALE